MPGGIGILKSDLRGEVRELTMRADSCIEEGRANKCPRVTELEADVEENVEGVGEGIGRVVVMGGESVIGNPRSIRICMALLKSTAVWNLSCIRRT